MSDIRFNQWKHQSGTGGVVQNASGNVGIGSTLPSIALDVGGGAVFTGIVTASSFSGNVTGRASELATNATGTNLTLSGDLGVGGTITYEDVKNVDSVGVITAREGIRIGAGKSIGSDGAAVVYYGDGSNLTGAGPTLANGSNDRVVTATGANALNGEANLTFGGSTLGVTGDALISNSGGNAKLKIKRSNTASNTDDYGSILFQSSANNNNVSIGAARQSAENDAYLFFSTASSGTLAERLRITSTGSIGVGENNPSAHGGEYRGIDVGYRGSGISGRTGNPTFTMRSNIFYDGSNWKYGEGNTSAGVLSVGGNQLIFEAAGNGTAGATATLSEKFRFDNANRFLIGTSTQRLDEKVHILGKGITVSSAENTNMMLYGTFGNSEGLMGTFNNIDCALRTNNIARTRWKNDGRMQHESPNESNCHFKCTQGAGNNSQGHLFENTQANHSWGTVLRLHVGASGQDRAAMVFSSANGYSYNWGIGSPNASNDFRINSGMGYGTGLWGNTRLRIEHNGTFHGSSSNNISDQRLKDNVQTITNATAKIKALTGRTFNWQARTGFDTKTKYGFIAQEVDAIIPELVCKENGLFYFDATDGSLVEEDNESRAAGAESSWDIDADGVTPILVEALKEAIAKIETLESKVAALES